MEHVPDLFIFLISGVHFIVKFMFVLNLFTSIWKNGIQDISFFHWECSQAQLLPNNYLENVLLLLCIQVITSSGLSERSSQSMWMQWTKLCFTRAGNS